MSNEEMSGGQPKDKASGDAAGDKDKVNYDTYSKVLGEAKSAKLKNNELLEKLESLQAQVSSLETDKMQASGNKDELIDKLKLDLADSMKNEKSTRDNYALNIVKKQIESRAKEMGCVKPSMLVSNIDLGKIRVDSKSFDVDNETMNILLDDFKKDNSFMFKANGTTINDVNPKVVNAPSKKLDVGSMTAKEIEAAIKKLSK